MKKWFLIPAIAMIMIHSGCSQPVASKEPGEIKKAKVVDVVQVTAQQQPLLLTKSGIIEANMETKLAFGTSGKITSLPVKKGMYVKQGQVLGAVDAANDQSALALSHAQIKEAEAKRTKILQGDPKVTDVYDSNVKQTDDSIAETESSIKKQKIKLENEAKNVAQYKAELQRTEALFASGALAKVDLDTIKTKLEQSELTVKSEQTQLAALQEQKKRLIEQKQLTLKQRQNAIRADKNNADRLASTATEIANAKNGLTQANKNIQDSQITAPFSGMIVEVFSHQGDIAASGSPVITLVDLSQVKIKVEVEAALISQFAPGKKVAVVQENGTRSEGTVSFVPPLAHAETGKYNVEITVPNANGVWRGGMLATVELPRKLSTGIVLPLQCMGVGEKGRYVLLVDNGVVRKQQVEAGQIIGDKIEILSGINPGDLVITSGVSFLVEGEKVTPKGA